MEDAVIRRNKSLSNEGPAVKDGKQVTSAGMGFGVHITCNEKKVMLLNSDSILLIGATWNVFPGPRTPDQKTKKKEVEP